MDIVSRMQEQGTNKIIVTYLLKRVGEFRKLCQRRYEVSELYHEFEHSESC
jgi:hypothetical protein